MSRELPGFACETKRLLKVFDRVALTKLASWNLVREQASLPDSLLERPSPQPFDTDEILAQFQVVSIMAWLLWLRESGLQDWHPFIADIDLELGHRTHSSGYDADADIAFDWVRFVEEDARAREKILKGLFSISDIRSSPSRQASVNREYCLAGSFRHLDEGDCEGRQPKRCPHRVCAAPQHALGR